MAYTGQTPDTHGRRRDWMERMACRNEDPDLFFDGRREHEARLICVARCPVRAECLTNVKEAERGLHGDRRDGVVAGLTHYERWRLDTEAKRRADDAPPLELDGTEPCGTQAAMLRHLWQGERVDGVCWSGEVRRDHENRTRTQPRPAVDDEPEPLHPAPGQHLRKAS